MWQYPGGTFKYEKAMRSSWTKRECSAMCAYDYGRPFAEFNQSAQNFTDVAILNPCFIRLSFTACSSDSFLSVVNLLVCFTAEC